MAESTKPYLRLVRPFTLIAPVAAGALGYYALSRSFDIVALFMGLVLALLQGAGQVVNQIADIEVDRINKPYRPLVRGEVSIGEAKIIAVCLYVVALVIAVLVSFRFFIIASIVAFFSCFYNIGPIKAKRNFILSYSWLAISRGLLPWIAASMVAGNLNMALKFGIVTALWVWATQCTKDVPDVEGDRLAGIITLPVAYGIDGVRVWIAANGLIILPRAVLLLNLHPAFLYLGAMAVMCALYVDRPWLGENNFGWAMFYLGIVYIYLLACVINT